MVPRPMPESPTPPLIPQFFAGREVFITGATGFMGKVLVERLLWTCRDISQLHLLMRWKKDVPPEKRLAELKQSQVFDVIREHCPQQLDKLSVVAGDVTKHAFGLDIQGISQLKQVSVVFHSAATVKFDEPLAVAVGQNVRSVVTLMDICDQLPQMQVSVVFHSAATVKFDEPLAVAVGQNVRSVVTLMDICDQLPQMQVFIYVSTAYSNAELANIEERVYPAPASLSHVLALVDAVPRDMLSEFTPKLVSPKPNVYTFTKAMAESVVAERTATSQYATAIFRPTIVVSSLRHPFPGWIENLNGPSGVIVAIGKGKLRTLSCSGGKWADMIPVDMCIDTMIAVAWETGIHNARETRVYNCSSYKHQTTWEEFKYQLVQGVRRDPFNNVLWYPYCFFSDNSIILKILWTFLHTIPLYFLHYVYSICGFKSSLNLLTVCKGLQAMDNALKFFTTREWHFSTENVQRLRQRLSPPDAAVYNLDPNTINWGRHCTDFVKGTRKYLLREKEEDIAKAKRRMRTVYIMHITMKCLLAILLFRLMTLILTPSSS